MRRGLIVFLLAVLLFVFYYFGADLFGATAAAVMSIFSTLTVVSIAFVIFLDNRNPSSTLSWILVLGLLPVVGLIFYFLFGQNYFRRRKYDKKAEWDRRIYQWSERDTLAGAESTANFTEEQQRILRLSRRLSLMPVSYSSPTAVLTNGGSTFSELLTALRGAIHHIHMEYYIYRADDIGTQIQRLLIEKAKAGVEVRFMVDAVGSLQLPRRFLDEMREAGIKVALFGSTKFLLATSRVNYRNHRKIVVIDKSIGFIGGLNVGDEYLSRSKTYGFWRDTHMRIEGEAVSSLQRIFLRDWRHMTGEQPTGPGYFHSKGRADPEHGAVQIIASGPDNDRRALKHIFFTMITTAKRSVWIATPYFIPDEDILTALRTAALSGLDVRLLFPAKPDKRLPFWASHSYFPILLDAGVKIYEYEKGFLHSKLLIVDGETASIGTANMDMRSFHLNFEVNALLMNNASVARITADFERDLLNTTMIDPATFGGNKRMAVRFMESAARLLSPLL
ncbi:cardiolipin synthase [Saccharibacillus alkalitolerans]|uniref:Cardiolipin synthase n=1 Tax=Saccharibacillus alkalitolerans TaxID=2705290 RepID=A0ABX0F792_9BACL|nr:cardiolipin synthase [Saccharibacillus alkalitolerans]NGZ76183.1 cardiolipin synthase [Saccharibacillus alkalitolerans]